MLIVVGEHSQGRLVVLAIKTRGFYPYGAADVPHVTTGLTFTLDSTDPTVPLLVIKDDAGEVAAASTQAAGSAVWVVFGGLR